MDAALAQFLREWPAYEQTRALDELRASEHARLDALDQVYLDYTSVGALIACKAALDKLRRSGFAGGTITISSAQGDGYYLAEGQTNRQMNGSRVLRLEQDAIRNDGEIHQKADGLRDDLG